MSEALLKDVQNMLNEEKFTRATLGNYSIDRFKELDLVLEQAKKEHTCDDIKNICEEHLSHSKNSIIAVYFSGMIALSQRRIDDAALISLVGIFVDNHKWNIVKYLCERVLEYGESKFALRTLSECYKNDNDEEKMLDAWKRIVKIDAEEADLAKLLAERAEKLSDIDEATDYFKKSLHRYINKQLFTNVREIWLKLLDYYPEDTDFFFSVQGKVAKNISADKAVLLLTDVHNSCKKRGDINTSITILKHILNYDERDNFARKEITECFRQKYARHSQLEEYIRISNLTQNWRNVHEAIMDFEKHIAFDKGNFVFHRTWGVGRIASAEGDDIVIDFAKKRSHSMSLKMAVDALQTLEKNHIWVLKATMNKEKLREKIKNDPEWALKTIIKSYDNLCDIKRIKAELVPSVLTAGEWPSWNAKAHSILKDNPLFGVSSANINVFTVRDRSLSKEEKLYAEFKAEKKFFNRLALIKEFVKEIKNIEPDSERFNEMAVFFAGHLKPNMPVNEQAVSSYLLLKDLVASYPFLNPLVHLNFTALFANIENPSSLFRKIKDEKIKKDFLSQIKLFIPSWEDIYISLFPHALLKSVIDDLKQAGAENKIVAMIRGCFENYKDNREAVVWLYKNYREDPLFIKAGMTEEKIIITLVYLLELTYREIDNHRDTTDNKKINKQAYAILFKENLLENYIGDASREAIVRVYTLVEDVKDLDPADKLKLKNRILDRFPDFKFFGAVEKDTASRTLFVTVAKYKEKELQLERIMTEDIPANSKEIAFALSLGDLRENAEYKAAKEKQEILNSTVVKLKNEIERAQLFDPASVNTSRVSFGTVVTLANESKGTEDVYTILGPWESDPDNRIISYLSPFGGSLMNKHKDEKFDFAINGEKVTYTVKNITAAKL
ncbi:MAG: transcription elongation factor GreA [Spirochaetaceae bacterium]|jgi:transcription elongation factor GreA|nr:transcription elongation factor GreA [Spirochaetaceae bacterium]